MRGWPSSVADLAASLPTVDLMTLDAPTDSAVLWALVRNRLRAGAPPADALAEVVLAVAERAPDSRLNLLLTDGTALVATTWWHSLSVRTGPDHVALASEPWDDDPRWTPIDDRQLVVADLGPTPRVRVSALGT